MDIDLEKFFDTVPQDRRLSLVHSIIEDGEMESLIRKYFHSGVFVNGQNQWKKKSQRLWCLLKLGFPKSIADKVSSCFAHYQLVLRSRYLNMIYQNQSSKSADWFLALILP